MPAEWQLKSETALWTLKLGQRAREATGTLVLVLVADIVAADTVAHKWTQPMLAGNAIAAESLETLLAPKEELDGGEAPPMKEEHTRQAEDRGLHQMMS